MTDEEGFEYRDEEFLDEEYSTLMPIDNSGEVSLFEFSVVASVRQFKGQTSGENKGSWDFKVSSLDEFKKALWDKVHPLLKREITFIEDAPVWTEQSTIVIDDLTRFILFYDKGGKRTFEWKKLSTTTLKNWKDREIWLYIHVYSTSVSSSNLFKKVQKQLITPENRDRAGAQTTSALQSLTKQLKQIHMYHYKSSDINWMLWANAIQAAESHLQEHMVYDPPPSHIIHLFSHARTRSQERLGEVRRNVSIGVNINEGIANEMSRTRQTLNRVINQLETLTFTVKSLDTEFAAIEAQVATNRSVMTSVQSAVGCEETEFGQQCFSDIPDTEDIDHQ